VRAHAGIHASEAEGIARALRGLKSGNGWVCSCPSLSHGGQDKNPSLSLRDGNDGKLLIHCHRGCTFDDVMAALRSRGLIEEKKPHVRNAAEIIASMATRSARPAARTYSVEETFMKAEAQVEPLHRGRAWNPPEYERSHIYHDAAGNPCRLVAVKRKPDGDKAVVQFGRLADGSWDTNAPKAPIVPYRLPELLAAQGASPVFIVEGEKDVETLEALGHLATTNPNGALSWHADLNQFFTGLEIFIVPDADKTGEERVGMLCNQLAGVASSIKIVRLPGLEFREKHGEDITDWIKKHGHTNEEFIELARKVPAYEPSEEDKPKAPRILFETVSDLRSLREAQYLIDGWIPARSVGILFGKWGSFKTFIGFDWALHLAFGLPDWHGAKLPGEPCEVLIIAREGHAGFVKRVSAFMQHHGLTEDPKHLVFMRSLISFLDDAAFAALKEAIEALKRPFKFVLVDTVGRVLPGADMAKEQPITLFMERLQQVGELTAGTALGVHHENKSGDANGSMYFQNNSDFMFQTSRDGDQMAGKITCAKQKEDGDNWSRDFTLAAVELPGGKSSLVVDGVAAEDDRSKSPSATDATRRQRRALDAMDEATLLYGQPAPLGIEGVISVAVDRWRDELFARGILDKTAKNPRTDFKELSRNLGDDGVR
jgi:AAA domain